ncbi:MAG: hypothetical protein DMG57_25415 [Acidobacteria bacterium]|nr:MAG: hypothetical protein DMG57_25415 [Acidobacteriota bacterium]
MASGQGAVQVMAVTDTYFHAFDSAGKQIGSHAANGMLPLRPGDYQIKVNNSVHPISVQSKSLAKCSTGAVQVAGKTDEYYYVFDGAGTQLASAHINAATSLFPAIYHIRLNNTETTANVQAGSTAELKPGTINVEAPTDEYYYVFDSAAKQLASSHVAKATGLFAGNYTLKMNNSETKAEIRAGGDSNIPVGTLVAQGSTDEYYYVFNNAGTQLASAHLARPLALFPGTFTVKMNNSAMSSTVAPAATTEVITGAIVLQGNTDEYYYIFDQTGTQLGSAHLGKPLSFVPGEYSAKMNNVRVPVKAEPGRTNEYQMGAVTVKAGGSDYYYVFDSNGTQLASAQFNHPVALPAGTYSVKVGNNARPATVTAGQAAVVNW